MRYFTCLWLVKYISQLMSVVSAYSYRHTPGPLTNELPSIVSMIATFLHQQNHSSYLVLVYRIKSLLVSHRKGDPLCCISMTFDTIFFDGLIRRGTAVGASRKVKIEKYTLSSLTKLEDILGHRWYIRGLNVAGDFCYVKVAGIN